MAPPPPPDEDLSAPEPPPLRPSPRASLAAGLPRPPPGHLMKPSAGRAGPASPTPAAWEPLRPRTKIPRRGAKGPRAGVERRVWSPAQGAPHSDSALCPWARGGSGSGGSGRVRRSRGLHGSAAEVGAQKPGSERDPNFWVLGEKKVGDQDSWVLGGGAGGQASWVPGGRGDREPGLLGPRLGAWHWGGWVGRLLIDFCLPAVPAGGRANRAPSINRLAASLIKTFYS